jgi:alpha-1,2-mannosyltransferase
MLLDFRSGDWLTRRRLVAIAGMVAGIGGGVLVYIWVTGHGLTDRFGRPIGADFAGIWSAGRALITGEASLPYDPEAHFAFQRSLFGDPSVDVYGWYYPPAFLAVAAALATLPYLPALALWQAGTFGVLLAALARISRPLRRGDTAPAFDLPLGVLLVAGFPAVWICLGHGQNAFLTAGLLGLGLCWLASRPLLAGVCLGLLAFKPHLVLILPALLLAGGHWRTIASAAFTFALTLLAVTLWLGPGVWSDFLDVSRFAREAILEQGGVDWFKMPTLFAAARTLGAPIPLAYGLQAILGLFACATVALAAQRRADPRLVAALASAGALLVTPYAFDYDMMVLGVAIAFACVHGLDRGFAPWEKTALALAWIAPLLARSVMQLTHLPLGLLAMLALFTVLARRALAQDAQKEPTRSAARPIQGASPTAT